MIMNALSMLPGFMAALPAAGPATLPPIISFVYFKKPFFLIYFIYDFRFTDYIFYLLLASTDVLKSHFSKIQLAYFIIISICTPMLMSIFHTMLFTP